MVLNRPRVKAILSYLLFSPTMLCSVHRLLALNLPQTQALPAMPSNHVAHIIHQHDFPQHLSSCSACVPEYSQSAVVGYDNDSSDEDDGDGYRTPLNPGRNTLNDSIQIRHSTTRNAMPTPLLCVELVLPLTLLIMTTAVDPRVLTTPSKPRPMMNKLKMSS